MHPKSYKYNFYQPGKEVATLKTEQTGQLFKKKVPKSSVYTRGAYLNSAAFMT